MAIPLFEVYSALPVSLYVNIFLEMVRMLVSPDTLHDAPLRLRSQEMSISLYVGPAFRITIIVIVDFTYCIVRIF